MQFSVFVRQEVLITDSDSVSGIRSPDCSKLAKNQKNDFSQFPDMTSTPIFFEVVLFLLSGLVTGLSFMSISALVLEL